MKNKKNIWFLFIVLFITLISFFDYALWKSWKDNWNRVTVNTITNTTIVTYCPWSEELIDSQKNQNPWLIVNSYIRNWILKCMVKDTNAPIINVNWNWYNSWFWTNKNVDLNITISDVWLWLENSRYKINWEMFNISNFSSWALSSSLNLSFTDEWTYNITIWAEDMWEYNSYDATYNPDWNKVEVSYTVNIDKSPMVLSVSNTNYSWENTKPIILSKFEDKYKWQSIEIKTFTCTWKPSNSKWLFPVLENWDLVWTCNPTWGVNCNDDNNYTPNPNDISQWCNWECNDWYEKYNWQCYAKNQTFTCDSSLLPTNSHKYWTWDTLVIESNTTKSYWIAPNNVWNDWKFVSTFSTWVYSPSTNDCSFDCRDWYHWESWKCVNNVSIVCCQSNYPLIEVGWSWPEVDCSDPINSTHPSCVFNTNCWWYVKDVMKFWDINEWKYTDWDVIDNDQATACWIKPLTNSNWFTCDPRYYLYSSWATTECLSVPIWEWSWQENWKYACTNKPNNSYYTSNWDNNNCNWNCNTDYIKSWNNCVRDSRIRDCNSKPNNTIWNSVWTITQYKNWSSWEPSLTPTYNTTSSISECRYKCANWYHTEDWWISCISNTKYNQICIGLPENASWNIVNNIDQTWDWTKWTPTLTWTYNQNPSTTQCRFECNNWYSWNWSSCIQDKYESFIYNWEELFALDETKDFSKIHDNCVILDVYNDTTDNKVTLTNNLNNWNLKIIDAWTDKKCKVYMLCSDKVSSWWTSLSWYPCTKNWLNWIFYNWVCNVWNFWQESNTFDSENISSYCEWNPTQCE